jgi:hypothetical protein
VDLRRPWLLLVAALFACAHPRPALPERTNLGPLVVGPRSASEAEAMLAARKASEPQSFRMEHQVAARYQGQLFLMNGYLLGRGQDFRVVAVAALGPRLFDVVQVAGQWHVKVHLDAIAKRFDVRHVGLAVQRIYFLDAHGPLHLEDGHWVQRSSLSGDDELDEVETWRDATTLALVAKRFFHSGTEQVRVDYDEVSWSSGQPLATHVRLSDARGFSLELKVTDYKPGWQITDRDLQIQAP